MDIIFNTILTFIQTKDKLTDFYSSSKIETPSEENWGGGGGRKNFYLK